MSALTEFAHGGLIYRIGDRVICTAPIIGGPDHERHVGQAGTIDGIDDGDTCSDDETGLVRVTFDFDGDGDYWWMKPGTNIRLLHKPIGLVLTPKRKLTLS